MRRSVDRELVEQLLQDESLSFREIARRANCSDFSVRAVARELATYDAVDYTVEPERQSLTPGEWGIFAGVVVAVFGGIWFFGRWFPPMDGAM